MKTYQDTWRGVLLLRQLLLDWSRSMAQCDTLPLFFSHKGGIFMWFTSDQTSAETFIMVHMPGTCQFVVLYICLALLCLAGYFTHCAVWCPLLAYLYVPGSFLPMLLDSCKRWCRHSMHRRFCSNSTIASVVLSYSSLSLAAILSLSLFNSLLVLIDAQPIPTFIILISFV